jgi:hypothetical protein
MCAPAAVHLCITDGQYYISETRVLGLTFNDASEGSSVVTKIIEVLILKSLFTSRKQKI